MNYPKDLRYIKSHEWVKEEGDSVLVGLTHFAQSELGDIVYMNLPLVGDAVTAGESFADVESVKAVSEVISPVTGVISEVNEELADAPEKINQAPYQAWIVRVKEVSATEEYLSAEEYEQLTKEG